MRLPWASGEAGAQRARRCRLLLWLGRERSSRPCRACAVVPRQVPCSTRAPQGAHTHAHRPSPPLHAGAPSCATM
jgi:hypothetical protein